MLPRMGCIATEGTAASALGNNAVSSSSANRKMRSPSLNPAVISTMVVFERPVLISTGLALAPFFTKTKLLAPRAKTLITGTARTLFNSPISSVISAVSPGETGAYYVLAQLPRRSIVRMAKPHRYQATAVDLLASVGVVVNGPEPWDMQVHDDRLYPGLRPIWIQPMRKRTQRLPGPGSPMR